MSAEKYMARAVRAAESAVERPYNRGTVERAAKVIAALCAEIEAETREAAAKIAENERDKVPSVNRERGRHDPLNKQIVAQKVITNDIAAAIRAGKP